MQNIQQIDILSEDKYSFSKKSNKRKNKNSSKKKIDLQEGRKAVLDILAKLSVAIGVAKGYDCIKPFLPDQLQNEIVTFFANFILNSLPFKSGREQMLNALLYLTNSVRKSFINARNHIDKSYISAITFLDSEIEKLNSIKDDIKEKIKEIKFNDFHEESEIELFAEMMDYNLV